MDAKGRLTVVYAVRACSYLTTGSLEMGSARAGSAALGGQL